MVDGLSSVDILTIVSLMSMFQFHPRFKNLQIVSNVDFFYIFINNLWKTKRLWKTNEGGSYGGKTGEDARVEMRREAFKKRKFLESF